MDKVSTKAVITPRKRVEVKDDDSQSSFEEETKEERIRKAAWKTKEYWTLPENVRKAIDYANMNKKHSDFYYKL